MLSADSSALNSDTDDQRSATPPMIPSVAALSCTLWTSERMLFSELPGNARVSSLTRKSDASARRLLEDAAAFRSNGGDVTQLEASTQEGSVFVVRDGARRIAATTGPSPTVGLVFYDLKSCLRGTVEEPVKRTRRPKKEPA